MGAPSRVQVRMALSDSGIRNLRNLDPLLLKVSRGAQANEPLQAYSMDGFVLAYSPDGKTLATSSRDDLTKDTTVQLWDAFTCKHKSMLTPERFDAIYSIAFSPDGHTLAGGGRRGEGLYMGCHQWRTENHVPCSGTRLV